MSSRRPAQPMRTTLAARMQSGTTQLQIEGTVRGSAQGLRPQDRGDAAQPFRGPRARTARDGRPDGIVGSHRTAAAGSLGYAQGTEGIRSNPGFGGPALGRRSAFDDDPRRRAGDHPCLHCSGRRLRPLWHLESARRTSRPDTARVSVGGDRQIRTNQQSAAIECCVTVSMRPHRH